MPVFLYNRQEWNFLVKRYTHLQVYCMRVPILQIITPIFCIHEHGISCGNAETLDVWWFKPNCFLVHPITIQRRCPWLGAALLPLVIQGPGLIGSSAILNTFQGHPGSRQPDPHGEDEDEAGPVAALTRPWLESGMWLPLPIPVTDRCHYTRCPGRRPNGFWWTALGHRLTSPWF